MLDAGYMLDGSWLMAQGSENSGSQEAGVDFLKCFAIMYFLAQAISLFLNIHSCVHVRHAQSKNL